jgi:hypothetical protein
MAISESVTKISEMAPYDFWAAPYAIGLCPEDVEAVKNGTASADLQSRCMILIQMAQTTLIHAEVGTPWGKPS